MSGDRWAGALRHAARLGVAPRAFWGLSLREWRAIAGPAPSVFTRADLERLMAAAPDVAPGMEAANGRG